MGGLLSFWLDTLVRIQRPFVETDIGLSIGRLVFCVGSIMEALLLAVILPSLEIVSELWIFMRTGLFNANFGGWTFCGLSGMLLLTVLVSAITFVIAAVGADAGFSVSDTKCFQMRTPKIKQTTGQRYFAFIDAGQFPPTEVCQNHIFLKPRHSQLWCQEKNNLLFQEQKEDHTIRHLHRQ